MNLKTPITFLIIVVITLAAFYFNSKSKNKQISNVVSNAIENSVLDSESEGGPAEEIHPLSIETLRRGEYPGSDLLIEQTLAPGSNYKRYVASYKSEGLKIYGLLTVPNSKPETGWPIVIFNHGYIAPSVYKTTEKYVAYQDAFARAGYLTFKSDYRGHGNSEGNAQGGYGSNDYTIDVLNAVSSIKKYPGVNVEKIGMWGHSMGGSITLKAMVTNKDVKAGVIWAGVVGSYPDLVERWRRRQGPTPTSDPTSQRGRWRRELIEKYGEPSVNPDFWNSISANHYLTDISGPIQLHHGTSDSSVPLEFSQSLEKQMNEAEKSVELFVYQDDDHNLSNNLSLALRRSVEYFDLYLK